MIQPNDKHQPDPLVLFCGISDYFPRRGVFCLNMGPTRSTLIMRRSQLSHPDFDKMA